MRSIEPDIDAVSDDELLAFVMAAYKRTGKIASRGVWGYNKEYASASGVCWKAYGHDFFRDLGASKNWEEGFDEGFEFYGKIIPVHGDKVKQKGFDKGMMIAKKVFDLQRTHI